MSKQKKIQKYEYYNNINISAFRSVHHLVPGIPDLTSGVSGWCTCDPEQLSSAVYTDTENRHTSSGAHSLWQRWRVEEK